MSCVVGIIAYLRTIDCIVVIIVVIVVVVIVIASRAAVVHVAAPDGWRG
jgi:hypothetical protein